MADVTMEALPQPIELGCDYWFTNGTKCAESARVRLLTDDDELLACPAHQQALRESLEADA